jgi:hypothetical protein
VICRDGRCRQTGRPQARIENASFFWCLISGAFQGGFPANSRESAGPSSPFDRTPVTKQPDHSPKNKGRARRPVCFHSPRWRETCRFHGNARNRGPRRSGNPTCALKNRSRAGPRSARNSNYGFSPITFSDDRQTRACQDSCWRVSFGTASGRRRQPLGPGRAIACRSNATALSPSDALRRCQPTAGNSQAMR